jgi:hypothetical protein
LLVITLSLIVAKGAKYVIAERPSAIFGERVRWRFFDRHGVSSKNSVQAAEQDRQRDGGQEGDHNKGDRHCVRWCLIAVDTHRTTLLFAEATRQIGLGCRRSNRATAMREAQQHG